MDKKEFCFGCKLVLGLCWVKFRRVFLVGLVLCNVCKREMLSKFCQDPYSCFGYRLSYNHPNEVILIGKEP